MCYKDDSLPFYLPWELRNTSNGTRCLTYTILLGKVTTKRNGEHISSRGLLYPIHQTIHDVNAKEGNHEHALHFAANPECTLALPDSYGSHRLAVLPPPDVWDPHEEWNLVKGWDPRKELQPPKPVDFPSRCWHSNGCTILFCMDCWKLKPEDLTNMDFWRAFKKSCELSDSSLLSLSRDQVWHRQIAVSRN
jgi:hypothetical protein